MLTKIVALEQAFRCYVIVIFDHDEKNLKL